MDIVKDPTTKSDNNLTRQQKLGLKLLKERENLHISKSDKFGDFVMTTMDNYRRMTIKHLETTTGVYKRIHPTRKVNGIETPVQRPTHITYQNQINSKCRDIESACNKLWREICGKHENYDSRFEDLHVSSYSVLPKMYTLVKTHKFPANTDYSEVDIEDIKVRPIVSCCGSVSHSKNLHISKSDKCGDFVMTTMDNYRRMTIKHLETTTGVYKWIHPTRKVNGIETPVQRPTHITYQNQ